MLIATSAEKKLNIVSASGIPLESVSISKEIEKEPEQKIDYTKKEFEERHGFNAPRPVGPNVLIEIYKHEFSKTIHVVDQIKERTKWASNVGRVCKIGSACYKGERFQHWSTDELPKIGDWVTFKPNSGTLVNYGPPGKGVDVVTIYDDCILNVIEDPSYVIRD